MRKIDYITQITEQPSISFTERELKGSDSVFVFSSSITSISRTGESNSIDTGEIEKSANFFQNLKYWNQETKFLSTNNLENSHFKEIVNMGIDAVPFIVEELKKGPSQLVRALDLIFPGVMKYNGFVSLKEACDKWLSILLSTDRN